MHFDYLIDVNSSSSQKWLAYTKNFENIYTNIYIYILDFENVNKVVYGTNIFK